jgi:hypothetical protein
VVAPYFVEIVDSVRESFKKYFVALVNIFAREVFDEGFNFNVAISRRLKLIIEFSSVLSVRKSHCRMTLVNDFLNKSVVVERNYTSVVRASDNHISVVREEFAKMLENSDGFFEV